MVHLRRIMLLFAGLLIAGTASAADDAFTSKPAQDAKAKYDEGKVAAEKLARDRLTELRKTYITDLTAARKQALTDDDLDEAQRILAFTKKLEDAKDNSDVPEPAEAFKSKGAKEAHEKYQKAKAAADKGQVELLAKLRASYVENLTGARKEALEANDLDEAQRIVAVIKAIRDGAFEDWIVLFRSDDPAIWNKDVNERPDHFARPLDKVPSEKVRYLKITNTQSKEFAVIEMTKDRLSKRTDDGRYGWEGTSHFTFQGRHLGIYDLQTQDHNRGDICVALERPGLGWKGWGFGHLSYVDTQQGYTWAGKSISKTVFEIAVAAGPLTAAEKERLLKK